MDKIVKDFGNYIRERRKEKGLTQEEVAKKLSISQVSYGRYELGTREPGLNLMVNISKTLEFDLGEILNYLKDSE